MISVTYHIEFDFPDRKAADLDQLNQRLAAMKLLDVSLDDINGYLATTKDGEGNLLHRRYGLDNGTLTGTPGSEGHCFQLDTLVEDRSVNVQEIMENWRNGHPEEEIHRVCQIGFPKDKDVYAYIVLHYHKV